MKKTNYFQNCLGVFQGGGCKAIAFAGAYEAAVARGVFFSELSGTSAGSIFAVLVGAGATPKQLLEIINRLDFSKFLGDPIPDKAIKYNSIFSLLKIANRNGKFKMVSNYMRFLGVYNSNYIASWINSELQKLLNKPGEKICFKHLFTPTTVVSTDLNTQSAKIWNDRITPDEEVGIAVQTSCSIPFYFQPHERRYIDGGMVSNLPTYFLKPESIFNRVLAFGFEKDQTHSKIDNGFDLFERVILSAIDGATDIQLQLQDHVTLIKINTDSIKSTDFLKMDDEIKKRLINNGREATNTFFEIESQSFTKKIYNDNIASDITESFNLLIKASVFIRGEILIAENDTSWIYSLFPLLLKWKQDGSKVKIMFDKNGKKDDHRDYKFRLLKSLNFNVIEVDTLPFKGFIMDGTQPEGCAIIINDMEGLKFFSKYYSCEEDLLLIQRLVDDFSKIPFTNSTISTRISFARLDDSKIIEKLKSVKQYSDPEVDICLEAVDIDKIVFLTKYLKGYKYRMVEVLYKIYLDNKIPLFDPAVIRFVNQKESWITPPVLEKHGNTYIVIEGNARIIYAAKNGVHNIRCAVVKNVKESLPTGSRYNLKQVLVADVDKRGQQRYDQFSREQYRRIEETVRAPKSSLT